MNDGHGQDSKLSDLYTGVRTIRLADGPDIVHLNTIAKEELKRKTSVMGSMVSGTNKNIEKYGKFKDVKVNTIAKTKPVKKMTRRKTINTRKGGYP